MNVLTSKRPKRKTRAKAKPRQRRHARDGNNSPKRRKVKISAKETLLRIEHVRRGDANNRIEGISSGPEANTIFADYISGNIEVTEIVPRLKLLYSVR
jgi:hypothetical protein